MLSHIMKEFAIWHNCASNQCEYKAKYKGDLKKHLESQHQGVCYLCNKCDYRAKYKGDLKKHVESQHEGVV